MGNSGSFGGLRVEVDSHNIVAGECITGKVHLYVRQVVHGSVLSLRFSGKESVSWAEMHSEKDHSGKSTLRKHPHTRSHPLLSLVFPLATFPEGIVPVGQFSYPFSIRTPTTMAASLYLSSGDIRAEIKYALTAFVEGQTNLLKSKAPLAVTRDINPLDGVCEVEERRIRVTSCYCIVRGEVGLAVFVDKDAYFPGETVNIDVKVSNEHCSVPVVGLKAAIRRELVMLDSSDRSIHYNDVLNETVVKTMIPPGKSLRSTQNVHITVPVAEESGKPFSAPSVTGKLLRCRYRLEVEVSFGAWLGCTVTPRTFQDLSIFQRTSADAQDKSAPEGWDPLVLPLATFG